MKKFAFIVGGALILSTSLWAQPAQQPTAQEKKDLALAKAREAENTARQLLNAIQVNDMAAFVAVGGEDVKAALSKKAFAQVHDQVGPRLKKGYEMLFLTDLKQGGYQVYLWKLSFKDEGDDTLATLSLQNGKVAGFFLT